MSNTSLIRRLTKRSSSPHDDLVNKITSIIGTTPGRVYSVESANSLFSLESLTLEGSAKVDELDTQVDSVMSLLKSVNLDDLVNRPALAKAVKSSISNESYGDDVIRTGMELASLSLVGGSGSKAYAESVLSATKSVMGDAGITYTSLGGGSGVVGDIDLQAFEDAPKTELMAITATVNILAAINTGFEETFYTTVVMGPGQNGVTLTINDPKVYRPASRKPDGSYMALVKTSISKAIRHPEILLYDDNKVVIIAKPETDPLLVDPAVIPNIETDLCGQVVETRPIKFGTKVGDILGASTNDILLHNQSYDSTDALQHTMNVGVVYYKVTVTDGTTTKSVIIADDMVNRPGSLFTPRAVGQPQDYVLNLKALTFMTSKSVDAVTGLPSTDFSSVLNSLISQGATDPYTIIMSFNINGEANIEYCDIACHVNSPMVTGVYNAVNEIVTVSQSAITVEPLGYIPKLRRTNLNMRTNSLMVDNRVLHTYNFSVALKPSVTVQTYIGANHTGIDALLPLIKIRNTAYAVQTFERLERSLQALDATRGLPVGSTYFASEHVVPYYRTHNITVTNVESLRSQDKELDIRSQIIAALRLMISTCLNDSNYKVALKLLLENENDFKVLIVTDPVLYSFIWESGDDRTLGDNVDYSIVNSINPFFKDKIYFTFTTNSRAKQLHQLNFGCHPVAPYIVQQSTVPRNGVLLNEISVIPREDFFVFLPILGRINILDMGKLFVDPFIDSVGDLVNANNANTSNI